MKLRQPHIALMALALIGCGASHPSYSVAPPSRLTHESRDDHQLMNAHVPEPGTAKTVSLRGILAYADQHSPFLGVSRAELLRGDAAIRGADPLLPRDPVLMVAAGPRIGDGGAGLDTRLQLSQELEVSGARALRREAARRFHDVKSMELEQARWLVHQRVHALFHQALVARQRAATADKLLAFSESLVSIAERRLKAGDISPLPVRVAQGELAQARQAKVAADGAYTSVRLTLAEVAGWPIQHLPVPAGRLDGPRKAPAATALVALAEKNNTTLQTRVTELRHAEARHRLADHKAVPNPTLRLQYNRESDPAAGIASGAEADVLLVGVGLPIPLWRGNVAERSEASVEIEIARARLASERQRLAIRIVRAANQVNVGADQITAYGQEILPTFEKNLELIRRAFELGEIEILDVSVAQRRFLEIQQSALSAYQEYYQAVAALELEVGAEIWSEERRATQGAK